ncbi:hypothetical protein EDB81DRAFT_49020 [Dactylonectria macrodidyma]|uniref:Secreted protein n=1 Tax=Dactylonectria macrodidyma TaxID=307937 RepID=A0A9P9JJA1_9HYPO|nr:hypothetical protein EDB81DRAFT_49020 [Dactylonectria macrodidyma]
MASHRWGIAVTLGIALTAPGGRGVRRSRSPNCKADSGARGSTRLQRAGVSTTTEALDEHSPPRARYSEVGPIVHGCFFFLIPFCFQVSHCQREETVRPQSCLAV